MRRTAADFLRFLRRENRVAFARMTEWESVVLDQFAQAYDNYLKRPEEPDMVFHERVLEGYCDSCGNKNSCNVAWKTMESGRICMAYYKL